MAAIDMMRREILETYVSPEQRAAYRAGLSTAAAICDEKAAATRKANPGRKRGSASQIGEFGAGIATSCGDAISAARDDVGVDRNIKQEQKIAAVRRCLG